MKIILADYVNDGVVHIGTDLAVANQLKSGLVDTRMFFVWPEAPFYADYDENFYANDQHFYIQPANFPPLKPIVMPDYMKHEIYLERRRLVSLRKMLFKQLFNHCRSATQLCENTPWPGIENNLDFALKNCDPDHGIYSQSVQEYAYINSLENIHAYKELKLQVDNLHSMKLRIYSYLKHFSSKINQVTTGDQAEDLSDEIRTKFYKDTLI